jgi:WXG100 family type VII secretion target
MPFIRKNASNIRKREKGKIKSYIIGVKPRRTKKMAEFRTNTAELKTKATELQTLNQRFKTMKQGLETTEAALNGMWEGEARTAFHTAFSKDMIQLNNFMTLIEKYIQSLNQIAEKYQTAEVQNTNIATTRKY